VKPREFVDHYETLMVSPNADAETVDRVYRLLARRYHPDNQESGNAERFAQVQEAFETLGHSEKRAAYDVKYEENRGQQWKIFDQQSAGDGREEDKRVLSGVLSLLYVAKRRDPQRGGLGPVNLERLLGVPAQHLEFTIWYCKAQKWIETQDGGLLSITVHGVDRLAQLDMELPRNRLLPEARDARSPEPDPTQKKLDS
jgi:curved DNA-binding protein